MSWWKGMVRLSRSQWFDGCTNGNALARTGLSGRAIRTDESCAATTPRLIKVRREECGGRPFVVRFRCAINTTRLVHGVSSSGRSMMRMSRHCRSWPFMSAAINQTVAFGAKQALLAEHTRTIVALRESEERFRSAFDHAAIGMALVAPSGKWVKVNRSLSAITGFSESEFRTLYFHSLTHPEDLDAHQSQVGQLLSDEIAAF